MTPHPKSHPNARRAVLIYNPMSGKQVARRTLPQLVEILSEANFDIEPLATAGPGDATRLARQCTEAGDYEVAFALGGDGTLREVAKGLLGGPVALGPLPAGTANVLAYAFRLPRNPLAAARALTRSQIVTMDVGMAGDEPFLMMVSVGLDAAIMAQQDPRWKRLFGPAAIAASGVGHWWSFPYPDVAVEIDGETLRGSFVALCNIPFYGGPFQLAPAARYDDSFLHLVCFRGRGRFPTLGFGTSMVARRLAHRTDVSTGTVKEARLLGPFPHGLQIDGDVLPVEDPVRVRVAESSLSVLAPVSPPAKHLT